ncbi:MAG: aminomethyl-transferring glycine dehydrogenase [Saprospiraceae bacterium]|nr:aminomethyl-transferring glycine dehydrogenase [Saprospiraceae bacterium]
MMQVPFRNRHIGINDTDLTTMLQTIGVTSLDQLMDETIPRDIRLDKPLDLPAALSEFNYLSHLEAIAARNSNHKSLIGQGFYGTVTPAPILRNVFQNPGWYTQYTPYQAEISQGRLEALLNFQTMIADLTALPLANASLLDEGTAAAEAMLMFHAHKNKRAKGDTADHLYVAEDVFATTTEVVRGRAIPQGITIKQGPWDQATLDDQTFAILLQYPGSQGHLHDFRDLVQAAHEKDIYVIVAADLLALAVLTPPGEWGADAVVGNTQRFGVPMGAGGPHAAFFATKEEFKRQIPGRIIGVSIDDKGKTALRMALQTREQHIKREKATSNICTAQALLAIMAGMYGVYHGPEGLHQIATTIHRLTWSLAGQLHAAGLEVVNKTCFDTLTVKAGAAQLATIRNRALQHGYNFFYTEHTVTLALDETCSEEDVARLTTVFTGQGMQDLAQTPDNLHAHRRSSTFMTHPVFHKYRSESQLMRYIKRLENKDLSLVHSMIPLGSCTMKLNAATELFPVSWPAFAEVHPLAPADQLEGYRQLFNELEAYLCEITGFTGCSLQPNSGASGEYTGLLVIRAYHHDRGDQHRNIALIPESAHGTNPASAVMAGMEVVVVACDAQGNIDLDDLRVKCEAHANHLSALMVTYPSTHGVFEKDIRKICQLIHEHGGLVYMDGANMNAQVGLTNPARIGADVCHLNLHKTFAIPHGGGGPGMGPICVNDKLKPYLPGHPFQQVGGDKAIPSVSSAPWGSASILIISYGYIRMMGFRGLKAASEYAILNANYIKSRLEGAFEVVYTGEKGRAAHELIIDARPFKALNISAEDIAKRLMDYSFHAPTLSFPVAGTLMIEPTESEDKDELDRFCEAMLAIKQEIDDIASGKADPEDNVLHHAPHTLEEITANDWTHAYTREQAAYPVSYLRSHFKFWPSVARVNNGYGDRNLVCSCPPMEDYTSGKVDG